MKWSLIHAETSDDRFADCANANHLSLGTHTIFTLTSRVSHACLNKNPCKQKVQPELIQDVFTTVHQHFTTFLNLIFSGNSGFSRTFDFWLRLRFSRTCGKPLVCCLNSCPQNVSILHSFSFIPSFVPSFSPLFLFHCPLLPILPNFISCFSVFPPLSSSHSAFPFILFLSLLFLPALPLQPPSTSPASKRTKLSSHHILNHGFTPAPTPASW